MFFMFSSCSHSFTLIPHICTCLLQQVKIHGNIYYVYSLVYIHTSLYLLRLMIREILHAGPGCVQYITQAHIFFTATCSILFICFCLAHKLPGLAVALNMYQNMWQFFRARSQKLKSFLYSTHHSNSNPPLKMEKKKTL